MGWLKALGKIGNATLGTAMIPIDVAKDVVTFGGDEKKTSTEQRVDQISDNLKDNLKEAYKETFKD